MCFAARGCGHPLPGSSHSASFPQCSARDVEITKLHEKLRACKQSAKQSLDDFLKTTNDCRDRLEERGAKPDREAYKHQINTGIHADIMALAL